MPKLSSTAAVVGMIFFGTCCSLLAKLIYSVKAHNVYGEVVAFEKPWFQVLTMFIGMSVCILLDLPRSKRKSAFRPEATPLITDKKQQQSVWIISIPTLLDLFATACGTTGLLYTSLSLYQMFRGAMLVWTALFSVLFLHHRLSKHHYCGILLCILGIAFVGLANTWAEENRHSRSSTMFGIGIIFLGQILQAGQTVMEEFLIKNLQMSSIRIVAWEGVFGIMHCLTWVFPILYFLPGRDHGHLENIIDGFYMVSNSWPLLAIMFMDMTMMLFYNLFGLEVTDSLSGVHRVVIETLRTLSVWLLDLFIYYILSDGKLGEAWTQYSYLQLIGFMLMVIGTLIYNYGNLGSQVRETNRKEKVDVETSSMVTTPICSYCAIVREPSTETGIIDIPQEDIEEEEDSSVNSYYGQVVGSGAHSPYLAATTLGTPTMAISLP